MYPAVLSGHQVPVIPHIINHQSLASIIVFDYWLCNRDRTRKNILLREEPKNVYRLWAIDHAEVFGSFNWQKSDLERLPQGLLESATHKIMACFIEDKTAFQEQVELIQTIPILLTEEIVSLIPDDWEVSKEEKKAMVGALIKSRRKILPRQIKRFIKKFRKQGSNPLLPFTLLSLVNTNSNNTVNLVNFSLYLRKNVTIYFIVNGNDCISIIATASVHHISNV